MNVSRWSSQLFLSVLCAAATLVVAPPAVFAATNLVQVVDNNFSPHSVTNNAGDTVKWSWTGLSSHSSTGSGISPLWDTGIHGTGFVFTHQFPAAGTFPYRCVVHAGQTGTIVVQPVLSGSPPFLSILPPSAVDLFQFNYTTSPGLSYVVSKSSDLKNWNSVATNTATANVGTFTDNTSEGGANFYRVELLPNP